MLEPLSQTAKAFRDTTISRSSRYWFDAVCSQWGIPHLSATPEVDWREAVRSNALGPRGTFGAVFEFVYYSLRQFNVDVDVSVSSAVPNGVTETIVGSFTAADVGKWIRLRSNGNIYRIDSLAGSVASLATATCHPYWKAADFSSVSPAVTTVAEVLPFVILEKPGLVIIYVSDSAISASPPTYLQPGSAAPAAPGGVNQEPGSEGETYNGGSMNPAPNAAPFIGADTRPAGEPFGGHLQQEEIFQVGDPLGVGPHPPYLSSGRIFDEYSDILDLLLAAGVRSEYRRRIS